MSKGLSGFQNNILLALERLRVVDEKLRARGVPIPERISKRRLLEEMARRYDKATLVRGRPHNETRLVRGELSMIRRSPRNGAHLVLRKLATVRVPGRRHTRVDHTFANSFYRAVKLMNQRFGVDILSVYVPPTTSMHSRHPLK